MEELSGKAALIKLAVFDVDGVLTDGKLILGEDGKEQKVFHVHDGLGLVLLRQADINVAVISARSTSIVAERMAALGIEYVYQGQNDKRVALEELMHKLGVTDEEVLFVGDDLIDLPVMTRAGLAIAVANAQPLVRDNADWVTSQRGGEGAVREVCDLLLKAQGKLEQIQAKYLNT